MKLGIAQIDRVPHDAEDALLLMREALDQLPDCQLVLLPELALCGYADPVRIQQLAEPFDGPTLQAAAQLARERGQGLVLGYAERSGSVLFNAVQVIGADGQRLVNYRKTHLWGGHETALFQPGEKLVSFEMNGLRFGLLVCYDLDFPEAARSLALAGVDVILCLSATTARYEVIPCAVVPARAYENGCFVAFANRGDQTGEFPCVGLSRIVRPDACVLAGATGNGMAVLSATLDMDWLRQWRLEHPGLKDRQPWLTVD